MLLRVGQGDGSSGSHQQNYRCAGFADSFQKSALGIRKSQILSVRSRIAVCRVSLFPFQRGIQPQAEKDHIASSGSRHRLADPVVRLGQRFHLIPHQIAAFRIIHSGRAGQFSLYSLQNRVAHRRRTIIISFQDFSAVRVWPDDGNRMDLILLKWQQAVVFQQDNRLLRRSSRHLVMGFRIIFRVIDAVILCLAVEHSQPHPRHHHMAHRLINGALLDKSLSAGGQQKLIHFPAVQITPVFYSHRRRFLRICGHLMSRMKILDGSAVRDNIPVKFPLSPQNRLNQMRISAGGNPVDTIIGPHHALHFSLLHTGPESRQIRLRQILF